MTALKVPDANWLLSGLIKLLQMVFSSPAPAPIICMPNVFAHHVFIFIFFLICHSWTAHLVSSSHNKSTNDEAILQNVFLSMAFHTTYRLKFEQCHVFEDVLVLQILSQNRKENGSTGFIFAPEWNSVCLIWRTVAVSVILTDDQLIVPLVFHMFLLLIPQLLQALYPSFDITDRAFKQLK